MSNFKVGEKVVCVGKFTNRLGESDEANEPKINEMVEISCFTSDGKLYLLEYPRSGWGHIQYFNPDKFRKLDHAHTERICAEIIESLKVEEVQLN